MPLSLALAVLSQHLLVDADTQTRTLRHRHTPIDQGDRIYQEVVPQGIGIAVELDHRLVLHWDRVGGVRERRGDGQYVQRCRSRER